MRLTKWSKFNNLIPPTQNGFREGYRTNDEVFILLCAMEKARAAGTPLFHCLHVFYLHKYFQTA